MKKSTLLTAILALGLSGPGLAQTTMDHQSMNHNAQMATQMQGAMPGAVPTEPGQSAFATIAEIVGLLQNDPETDWNRVDIAALRAHLVDMDAVTLRAGAAARDIEGGAVFDVTSQDAKVAGSIRRMVLAHGQTMSGVDGITMVSEKIDGGARMTVTGPNPAMIRGLGFFGVLTLGMHHQVHHLALARGENPLQ